MSLPRFGVRHPVPVNLLMAAALLAGIFYAFSLRREFFPELAPFGAQVLMIYPGAAPEEVEETVAIKVEDAIYDIDEVDEVRTTLSEGGGGVMVYFQEGITEDQYNKAVDEVERKVDSIQDLPRDLERMQVMETENSMPVTMVSIAGDVPEATLKRAAVSIRDDLRKIPGMGDVFITGTRDYEIGVSVSEFAVAEYGIGLPEVADRITAWMADMPGGSLEEQTGSITIRTMGVDEKAASIEEIVLRATPDGQSLRVGDIATVTEGFVDQDFYNRYNGTPNVTLVVFRTGAQDIIDIAENVRAYVTGRMGEPFQSTGMRKAIGKDRQDAWQLGVDAPALPTGISLEIFAELARFLQGRVDLLTKNAFYGAILVFITLLVFLNWRAAFWVGVGLATALAGTMVLMGIFEMTLNFLTMFGLIVVLGLLVDDAIVVAENIQAKHDRGEPALGAAVKGGNQVLWPVVATVLTSIVAFMPLTFIKGNIGDMLGALPVVVSCALAMSLIESLLILPSHMGHSLLAHDRRMSKRKKSFMNRFETWRDKAINERIIPVYGRALDYVIRRRYISICIGIGLLVISFGMVGGDRVGYTFLPTSDSEMVEIALRMPVGTNIEMTDEITNHVEEAASSQSEVTSISATVGNYTSADGTESSSSGQHLAQLFIELAPTESRNRTSNEVIDSIRDHMAPYSDQIERLQFTEMSGGPGGADISIQATGNDPERLRALVVKIESMLSGFEGIYDISNDNTLGQRELQIQLRGSAAPLGLSVSDVARQVRASVFGLEAHTYAAEGEEIDVRVRHTEAARESQAVIENMWVMTPGGVSVPLIEVAQLKEATGYSTIRRVDRERAVRVTASTASWLSPEKVTSYLRTPGPNGLSALESLQADYPDFEISTVGRQQQETEAFSSLPIGFLAAGAMIYIILACLFGSYVQPFVVMLAIPFALIGVIWGHFFLGYDITFLSIIGFFALSGIVVNDSLILIVFYNQVKEQGKSVHASLLEAGMRRLRPIFLTTVTTVLGLTPLMLEQSFQARFLIPMAIAISFGLMSATFLILFLLPAMLMIGDDIRRGSYYLWHGRRRSEPPTGGQKPQMAQNSLG